MGVDKEKKSTKLIDIAIPGDCRVKHREQEKIEKFHAKRWNCLTNPWWSILKLEVFTETWYDFTQRQCVLFLFPYQRTSFDLISNFLWFTRLFVVVCDICGFHKQLLSTLRLYVVKKNMSMVWKVFHLTKDLFVKCTVYQTCNISFCHENALCFSETFWISDSKLRDRSFKDTDKLKPRTDEQFFFDKFSLSIVRSSVWTTSFLWQVFTWQVKIARLYVQQFFFDKFFHASSTVVQHINR